MRAWVREGMDLPAHGSLPPEVELHRLPRAGPLPVGAQDAPAWSGCPPPRPGGSHDLRRPRDARSRGGEWVVAALVVDQLRRCVAGEPLGNVLAGDR